jgi:integrase
LTFPLTIDQSNHYLKASLSGKWEKVRGWHVFRHSFISNCAAAGVDQRMIDAWSGHQTDEMRRRYTHLFPEKQRSAIDAVFQ